MTRRFKRGCGTMGNSPPTAADLELKLREFQGYFNGHRTHAALGGLTPEPRTGEDNARASVSTYRWRPHCRGLYQTPIAA